MNENNTKKLKSLYPYFLLAIAVLIVNRFINEFTFFVDATARMWGIITPFFYGFILAYIANIPIGSIQNLLAKSKSDFLVKRQRMFSILIVFIIMLALIALTLNLIVPAIADSIAFFIANIAVYWDGVLEFVERFNNLGLFDWYINEEFVFTLIGDIFADFRFEFLMQPLNAIVGAGTALFNGVIAIISSIYILIEKDRFKKYLHNMLRVYTSESVKDAIVLHFGRLNENFRQYIRTQTIDGIILGSMATVLLILLGSPYALVLGLMLGIVNYIPYFGSIFGTLVAVVVVLFSQGFAMGALAAGMLFMAQQIDANIIQPKLMSGSFSLSPLLVIISITVGGAFAGIFGMLIAIPIVAVLKDILDSLTDYYDQIKMRDNNENLQ